MTSPFTCSVLELTRTGPRISGDESEWVRLREEFLRMPCLHFRGVLRADLMQVIARELRGAGFCDLTHQGIGTEQVMEESPLWHQLNFLMNDSRLYQFIERITGCESIGCFQGRVYRVAPGAGHHDDWHSDVCDTRLIGVSINLGAEEFDGGVFELREERGRLLARVANTGLGDAIVFRIAQGLQHRIIDVVGSRAKTAFAGWFRAQPDYRTLLAAGNQS